MSSSKFDAYNEKSERYYAEANGKARSIQDSVLRKKIELLIANSKKAYESKIAEFNTLSKRISRNETTLSDSHSVLKILLTLPVLDKYQNEHLPAKDDLNSLIRQQEKLIRSNKKADTEILISEYLKHNGQRSFLIQTGLNWA